MSKKVTKVPTGNMFYRMIRIRFADCWDNVKRITDLNTDPQIAGNKTPVQRLGNNTCLSKTLICLFSFYAGRILEDCEETGLYTGPAQHRVRTILENYVNDACCLDVVSNPKMQDELRQDCYDDLKSIGCNVSRAHAIYSKKE